MSRDHIEGVRAATEEFRSWDARYGGGLMREAAVAQLRYCAELLNARCAEPLRRDLRTSVGSFAEDWHLRAKVLCTMSYHEFLW